MKKKLARIEAALPDAEDIRMLKEAQSINDDSSVALEVFKGSLEGYGGKILLRVPKSLHKRLAQEAQAEGVSLNQYALYKLAK